MSSPQPSAVTQKRLTNRILAALPPREKEMLQPHLETLALPTRMDLYYANRSIAHDSISSIAASPR